MASLPYVSSPGSIAKTLHAIKAASVPPKVNQDFVKDVLKIPGGTGDQMTSFLKKIGFTNTDGSPTDLYTKFRNPTSSGSAVAAAIRHGYGELYKRKEYLHELNDHDLLGVIIEETGQPHDAKSVKLTLSCIKNLKEFADFSSSHEEEKDSDDELKTPTRIELNHQQYKAGGTQKEGIGLNLGYTININLPPTSDQAVFNAIFKAIKENLLSSDDG